MGMLPVYNKMGMLPVLVVVISLLTCVTCVPDTCPGMCECRTSTGERLTGTYLPENTDIYLYCTSTPVNLPDRCVSLHLYLSGSDIPREAFKDVHGIRTLTVSGSVRHVKARAFSGMRVETAPYTSIRFEEASVGNIEDRAFSEISGYDTIGFYNTSLQDIHSYAFKEVNNVQRIEFANCNVNTIRQNAFQAAERIGGIELFSSAVTLVETCAFCSMKEIGEIVFNEVWVGTFGNRPFWNIERLGQFRLSNMALNMGGEFLVDVTGSGSDDSGIFIHNMDIPELTSNAFKDLRDFKTFRVSDGSIGNMKPFSFLNLRDIERIGLRNLEVGSMEENAMRDMSNCDVIAWDSVTVGAMSRYSFSNVTNSREVRFQEVTFSAMATFSIYSIRDTDRVIFLDVTFNTMAEFAIKLISNVNVVDFTRATFSQGLAADSLAYFSNITSVTFSACTFSQPISARGFNKFHVINVFRFSDTYVQRLSTGAFHDFLCVNQFLVLECDVTTAESRLFDKVRKIGTLRIGGTNVAENAADSLSVLEDVVRIQAPSSDNQFSTEPVVGVTNSWGENQQDAYLDCVFRETPVPTGSGNPPPTGSGDPPPMGSGDPPPMGSGDPPPTDQPDIPPSGFPAPDGDDVNGGGMSLTVIIVVSVVGAVALITVLLVVICCCRRTGSGKSKEVKGVATLTADRGKPQKLPPDLPAALPPSAPPPETAPRPPISTPGGFTNPAYHNPQESGMPEYLQVVPGEEPVLPPGGQSGDYVLPPGGEETYDYIDETKMIRANSDAYESLDGATGTPAETSTYTTLDVAYVPMSNSN